MIKYKEIKYKVENKETGNKVEANGQNTTKTLEFAGATSLDPKIKS